MSLDEQFRDWLDSLKRYPRRLPKKFDVETPGHAVPMTLPAKYCCQLGIPTGSSYEQAVDSLRS